MVKASRPVVRLIIRTAFGNRNAGVGGASSNSDDKETEQNAVLVLAASTSAFQAESTSSNLVYCSKDQKGLINVWVITPPVLVKKHCANTKRLCFSASLEFFRPPDLGA